MKMKQFVAFALVGLVLGSCKRPDAGSDGETPGPEGRSVTTRLAISVPNSIRTYAPGDSDAYAADEEVYAETIDVFIYENGGSYPVDTFHFERALVDFTSATSPGPGLFKNINNGPTFVTGEFQVREGDKLVYVGINLPNLIKDRLATGYYVNEIFEDPDLLGQLISNTTGGGASRVAYFSSTRGVNVKFDEVATGTPIAATISVNRLVAKVVAMTEGGSGSIAFNDVSGGTLTDFQFAIGQRNNQMFIGPLLGTPGQDPNHLDATITAVGAESPNDIRILRDVSSSEYKDINDILSAAMPGSDFKSSATNIHYTTENTSASHRHQDVTYVSVRAKFIPHFIGADPITGIAADYNDDILTEENGFYAVFTGDGGSGEDALGARYFETLAAARAFVTGPYFTNDIAGHPIVASTDPTYDDDAIQGTSDHYIFFYAESWCYYRIYLNPNGSTYPGSGRVTNEYDLLRNTVYVANITGVNYIGTTNPDAVPGGYENSTLNEVDRDAEAPGTFRGTPIYPGDWFGILTGRAPIYPEHQITVTPFAEGLSVSISIENWDVDDDDYELN